MAVVPFLGWLRELKDEINCQFTQRGGRIPRSLQAPFIDAKVYYDLGYGPRDAASYILGIRREPADVRAAMRLDEGDTGTGTGG